MRKLITLAAASIAFGTQLLAAIASANAAGGCGASLCELSADLSELQCGRQGFWRRTLGCFQIEGLFPGMSD